MKILVIQGPNLNVLGHRDPRIYGAFTLEQIHQNLEILAKQSNMEIDFFQSNFEGEIIDKIQECIGSEYKGIIINPAALSHTSIAILDALQSCGVPAIEVHISNIFAREDFRSTSMTAKGCVGVISGFGPLGYNMALMAIYNFISELEAIKKQAEEQNKEN